MPLTHEPPFAQRLLQLPQLALLVAGSTHTLLHWICPADGQPAMQRPFEHVWFALQRLAHVPQWTGSVSKFVHAAPQREVPVPHAQLPFVQLAPTGH